MGKKTNDEAKKEKSGKGKFIIITILALLVIGAGTFAGVFFYLQSKAPTETEVVTTNYILLTDVTLNLSDENGRSYLKTSLSLAYDESNTALAEELAKKTINLQDSAIWYLKARTSGEFSASNEAILKQGLMETLNTHLSEGSILDVFLVGADGSGFIVQKS